MENLIGIWDIVCLRVQLDKNQLEKNGGSAWDAGGNAKNRIKLIRPVLLGYNMKNQLSTTNDLKHIRLAVIK
jgi:hypothetical protein